MTLPSLNVALSWINKRIVLCLFAGVSIATYFWSQSRVPALVQKANMGERTDMGALGFDIMLPVEESFPLLQRIAYTTVNWAYTNWKGMAFGLLFAAVCLTLLRSWKSRSRGNGVARAFSGAVIGAPLGVCVNCATPIAYGLYRGGVRLETVLATLVSSPTLNVIVLSMSFALLPFEYAIAKLVAVLIFIFVAIPLLVKFVFSDSRVADGTPRIMDAMWPTVKPRMLGASEVDGTAACVIGQTNLSETDSENWPSAIKGCALWFAQDFYYVLRTTVPLMLFAGFLGAAVIESVPTEMLVPLQSGFLTIVAVALLGAFLPVPMSFDVIIVSMMLTAGVKPPFAMILLFTLGIFSIYPMMVIWRFISAKVALGLLATTVLMGIVAGYSMEVYGDFRTRGLLERLTGSTAADHQRVLGIAQKYCGTWDRENVKQSCMADFFQTRFATHGPEAALCNFEEVRRNEIHNKSCNNALTHAIAVKTAIAGRDLSACNALDIDRKLACMSEVIVDRIASRGESYQLCDQLPDAAATARCKSRSMSLLMTKLRTTDVCDGITVPAEKGTCLEQLEISIRTETRDFSSCEGLTNESSRSICLRNVAGMLLHEGRDASVCEKVTTGDSEICRNMAIEREAAAKRDPKLCEKIRVPAGTNQCKVLVIREAIESEAGSIIPSDVAYFPQSEHRVASEADQTAFSKSVVPLPQNSFLTQGNITVSYLAMAARPPVDGKPFTKHAGEQFGIHPTKFLFTELTEPFLMGRGIASGDFNNDNWPDIVLAGSDGVYLYKNLGGKRFAGKKLIGADKVEPFIVALVDINNDGWLDVFITGYGGKNFYILNDKNDFQKIEIISVPSENVILTAAASFGDIDRDGLLDLALGNFSFGPPKAFVPSYSDNRLLKNTGAGFLRLPLDEIKGETLSTLFTDINNDGLVDLIVGNDQEVPDMYYLNSAGKSLRLLKAADGIIPVTSRNTMSVDSADFDNDLKLDIFVADMSFFGEGRKSYCDEFKEVAEHQRCEMLVDAKDHIGRGNINWCATLPGMVDKRDCMIAAYRDVAIKAQDPALCDKIPSTYGTQRAFCRNLAVPRIREKSFTIKDAIPQAQSNKLLRATPDGRFSDVTAINRVGKSHWSWNAKFADLDNDEWQDIYVGNGFGFKADFDSIHSNVFYHNLQGKGFATAQTEFGLDDYLNTPSYTYVDLDNDGDLDIVATGLMGSVRVFINNESKNKSVSFELRDQVGNRFGVGSKVFIRYGENGKSHQVREIKSGGGYMSFDAPVAHFGLGKHEAVTVVEVHWSTGERTTLSNRFEAGRQYLITRKSR
jgi:uncharacterized membrane protein YraQ (UPF0718 family)